MRSTSRHLGIAAMLMAMPAAFAGAMAPPPVPRVRSFDDGFMTSSLNAPRGNANAVGSNAAFKRQAAKKSRVKAHRARSRN